MRLPYKKVLKTKKEEIKEKEIIIEGKGKNAPRYVLKGYQAEELSTTITLAQLHVILLDMIKMIIPYITLLVIWLKGDDSGIYELAELLKALIP